MKIKSVLSVALLALLIATIPMAGLADTIDIQKYLEGLDPLGIQICAYDPTRQSDEKVFYDAISLEYDLGDTEEASGNLEAMFKLLQKIDFRLTENPVVNPENNWRFSVFYGASNDPSSPDSRWIQMDFYDRNDTIHITIADGLGDTANVLFECDAEIPLEDSLVMEDIYIDTVARLKRVPTL